LFCEYLIKAYMEDYVIITQYGPMYVLLFEIANNTHACRRKSFIYRQSTLSMN
jgi:hypothetical protein